MVEDSFDKWNKQKKHIDKKNIKTIFKQREIYWASIGKNIGFEQNGKNQNFTRPILVFRKFSKNSFLGIPLTTTIKNDDFHFCFNFLEDKQSCASLSQIRLFDSKRLHKKIGKISINDFEDLKNKLNKLLFPPKNGGIPDNQAML